MVGWIRNYRGTFDHTFFDFIFRFFLFFSFLSFAFFFNVALRRAYAYSIIVTGFDQLPITVVLIRLRRRWYVRIRLNWF